MFLLLGLCPAVTLPATTVVPPSFEELVSGAELVFEGQVEDIASRWVGRGETLRIKTFYTIRVKEVLKGEVSSPYVLEVLGGTVGETTLKVEGAPEFDAGDEVILFVTANGTQFVPLVGIMHGHYTMERDPETRRGVVKRHDGTTLQEVGEIGMLPAAPAAKARAGANKAASPPLTPEQFKEKIRQKVREGAR